MHTLVRHQIGSVAATVVDFGTMTLLVSLAGLDPVPATAIGAACGGVFNFVLGRVWIFKSSQERASRQGARYAVVSMTSLGLNAAGEHLLVHGLGVMYLVARAIVALCVSLFWNYPMQRAFVFRANAATRSEAK